MPTEEEVSTPGTPPKEFVSPKRTVSALTELWNAVRTCYMNQLFHRAKAKMHARHMQYIDIASIVLASIAGLGILADFKAIPVWVWAAFAFASGIVNQLRPILRLTEKQVEELTLESEYGSILLGLMDVQSQIERREGLTLELSSQVDRGLARFKFLTLQRDKTEYRNEETEPLTETVNEQLPPQIWFPDYALEEARTQAEATETTRQVAAERANQALKS